MDGKKSRKKRWKNVKYEIDKFAEDGVYKLE
jgi:hypothetical protein